MLILWSRASADVCRKIASSGGIIGATEGLVLAFGIGGGVWHSSGSISKSSGSSARIEVRKTLASGGASGTVVVSGVGLSLAVMALRRTKSWMARSFGLGHACWCGFLCG